GTFIEDTGATLTAASVNVASGGEVDLFAGFVNVAGPLETTGGKLENGQFASLVQGIPTVTITRRGPAEGEINAQASADFTGAGTLILDGVGVSGYSGTITGFGAGDTIVLPAVDLGFGGQTTVSWQNGVLRVSNSNHPLYQFNMPGSYASSDFAV